MSASVCITGLSAFTPFGVGAAVLRTALEQGRVSVAPSSVPPDVGVASIRDFDPQRYTNVRGMRVYARPTQLEICAATLALADAGLAAAPVDPRDLGLVTAS